MTRPTFSEIVGTLAVVAVIAVVLVYLHTARSECDARGGMLVKTVTGWFECIDAKALK
jgi:hypothetical protein